jgi:hypothetical protein
LFFQNNVPVYSSEKVCHGKVCLKIIEVPLFWFWPELCSFLQIIKRCFFPWKEKLLKDFPRRKKTENKHETKGVLNFIPECIYALHCLVAKSGLPNKNHSWCMHRQRDVLCMVVLHSELTILIKAWIKTTISLVAGCDRGEHGNNLLCEFVKHFFFHF